MRKILLLALSMTLTGCLGMPETVKPVDEFNLHNYLGKWYEIARLDHSFEEGLTQVTAEYTLKDDGGVAVVNKGFLADENQWKEAEGKAYFVNGDSEGYLKVSFFGPFYGSYVVFALDKTDYQYAFVSGPNTDYLWLLARTPTVDQSLIDTFVSMAKERGFDTERLIFVEQK
ncbi:lipocalin family protein [Vibrio vulnificus]|uniref:lipocalin family protein n=1 Tax=Vibrio vulnificus TaxID=672 RepID=UPI00102A1CB9|nr:lipocalin family protein [Vibrio vulnificus]EGR0751773.1 lipocalin [Vibrio vulnificus]EGR0753711.1 lipocalin [Vibrio vulnificus]EIT7146259.1 lipocalin family protein [Vibrio vulnificus]EIT7146736.1 lipocalin family protein [Vibrio vulnificus]EIZ1173397.1 lipocalin family protein [Vibrio vulnificus]